MLLPLAAERVSNSTMFGHFACLLLMNKGRRQLFKTFNIMNAENVKAAFEIKELISPATAIQ